MAENLLNWPRREEARGGDGRKKQILKRNDVIDRNRFVVKVETLRSAQVKRKNVRFDSRLMRHAHAHTPKVRATERNPTLRRVFNYRRSK